MPTPISEKEILSRIESFKARDIKMLEPYKGKSKHIHNFKCLKPSCGYIWSTSFESVSRGTGCTPCAKKRVGDKNRLSTEDLDKRLAKLNERNIEMLDEYKNKDQSIRFKCKTCGHIFKTNFASLDRLGRGCRICMLAITSVKHRVNGSDLTERLSEIKNRNIVLISDYTKFTDNHEFLCTKDSCNYIWTASLISISRDKGCPRCVGKHLTDDEKLVAQHMRIITGRLRQIKTGKNTRVDKNSELMSELVPFWIKQISKLPEKPKNPDMTFHLDHIIPVKKFKTDIDSLKYCWDYRNFQWLEASVNISKSAKIQTKYFTDWHFDVCDKLGIKYD